MEIIYKRKFITVALTLSEFYCIAFLFFPGKFVFSSNFHSALKLAAGKILSFYQQTKTKQLIPVK